MRLALIVLACLLIVVPVVAQDKPAPVAPVLADVDALKLANLELSEQVLLGQFRELQLKHAALKQAFDAYAATLQKPGYILKRDEKTGAWSYVVKPPEQ